MKKKMKTKTPMKMKSAKRQVIRKATDQHDITELMFRDHKALKKLIKTMKSEDADLSEIRDAFEQFAPLLEAHAKPEEQSLYTEMKGDDDEDLRPAGFEGETEHSIADQLTQQVKATTDEDEFCARVKVLAELVEHHIEEEEKEMIPDIRKKIDLEMRVRIGQEYLRLRSEYGLEAEAA